MHSRVRRYLGLTASICLLVPLIGTRCAMAHSISYAMQVAPIIATQCSTCHGAPAISSDATPPPGGLSTVSYVALMRGGTSGTVVIPGSPHLSRILRQPSLSEQAVCAAYKKRRGTGLYVVTP